MQAQRGEKVSSRTRLWALALGVAVVALDQITKSAVVSALREGESRQIIGDVLRLSHIRNTGAAFGMLKGFGGIIALVAIVGVVAFAAMVVREPSTPVSFGAALVAAGASGNLIDRLLRDGGVIDFVDFRFWPAFNVADSAISIGAVLLLLSGAFERRSKDDERAGARP